MTSASRLDELGTLPLARFDHRPLVGPAPRPPLLRHEPTAFPTFDQATRDELGESGWDQFWADHPAGAGRLTRLEAGGYDDAVRAAQGLVNASKPNSAPGDKQAHALLQAADGAWYATGLGMVVDTQWGPAARLSKLGPLENYQRPKVTPLVQELRAIVGGVSTLDFRAPTPSQ